MDIKKLLNDLFPLNRAVTGMGLRQSLEMIGSEVPLELIEFPSGMPCFDWEVPQEWWIKEAYIESLEGERIVDFDDLNLHVLAYCAPFDGIVKREELLKHIYTAKDQSQAVPYITSVFEKRWGFCMSETQKSQLTDPSYRVKIDSGFISGSLTVGEGILRGKTDNEIVLFTYTGHPSMANDQLSGMAVLTGVYKWLVDHQQDLNFSYRILFCPETIGTAAYLSQNLSQMQKQFHAGYVLAFLGDNSPIRYKQSLAGDQPGDRAASCTLGGSNIVSFNADGSDERHFNAPGIDLPFGLIMRAGPGGYPEYHTSLDDLSLVSEDRLQESIDAVIRIIRNLESDQPVRTKYFGFEPKLDKLGLYPTLGKKFEHKQAVTEMLKIWRLSSRYSSLSEIAEVMGKETWQLVESLELARKIGLIEGGEA